MESRPAIIVLEDDSRRSNEMRRVIALNPLSVDVQFFDNAHKLRVWLTANIASVRAASLDYDLDTTSVRESADAGSGSDIADFLATLPPQFPILIHSSNAMRAPAMHMTLVLAGWNDVSLSPYTDAESWLAELVLAIGDTSP